MAHETEQPPTADQNMTRLLRNELSAGRITEKEFHEAWDSWIEHTASEPLGDKPIEKIEPCDASRAYLDTAFADIELRLEAGEFDIREAEDKRLEAYEYAVENIGVPRYE